MNEVHDIHSMSRVMKVSNLCSAIEPVDNSLQLILEV